MTASWKELAQQLLTQLDPNSTLASDTAAALTRYLELCHEWSQRVDLVKADDPASLVELLLADAAALSARAARGQSWVDVGSGVGAPGLPLAILRPGLSMTLVEPRQKRVAFLRTVLGALRLQQVSVVRQRSSALAPQGWDVAVSRATLPPAEWLLEGTRLARQSVWVLLARSAPPSAPNWVAAETFHYTLPFSQSARSLVRYTPDLKS